MNDDVFIITGLSESERVRITRLYKNLRQLDVASAAGVTIMEVVNLEKGRYISPESRVRILKVLDLDGDSPDD